MAEWLRLYVPAMVTWSCVLLALVRAGFPFRDPARRALVLVLLGVAVAHTVRIDPVYAAVSRLTGVPHLARLIGHAAVLEIVFVGQVFLMRLDLAEPVLRSRSRRWAWWCGGTLAAMCALFALADVPPVGGRFAGPYTGSPWILEYWLVLSAYVIPACCGMIAMERRYARLAGDPSVRVGLYLVAAGTSALVVYHLHVALYFAAARFGFGYPAEFGARLDAVLPVAGTVLVPVGATMPAWGRRLGFPALVKWVWRYRLYNRLRPLWRDLHRAHPQITLAEPPPLPADILSPHDLGLRLYRRVIEIRDGRLILRPRLDPPLAAAARARAARSGLAGRALDAVLEAVALDSALHGPPAGAGVGPAPPAEVVPGADDLDSDIAFLGEVALEYRRLARRRRFTRCARSRRTARRPAD